MKTTHTPVIDWKNMAQHGEQSSSDKGLACSTSIPMGPCWDEDGMAVASVWDDYRANSFFVQKLGERPTNQNKNKPPGPPVGQFYGRFKPGVS